MSQHSHSSTPFSKKTNPLVLICDNLQSPANIGAIFRLADAFGVIEIIFSSPPPMFSNRLKRTARNTENTVAFSISENLLEKISILKNEGYSVIALEITQQSKSLPEITKGLKAPIALIIGNEKQGVSDLLLQHSTHTHIEMYGDNSSMNVSQATAIALYELTKR